jgi:phosphate transport system permease protein
MLKYRKRRASAVAGTLYAWVTAATVAAICLLIVTAVVLMGKDSVSIGFLLREPSASALGAGDGGGVSTPIIGTVILTLIGIAIALPVSLATSIYMAFYARRGAAGGIVGLAVDVLSGVPTVVIALFALAVFTNPAFTFLSTPVETGAGVAARAYGRSFLVAGAAMAVMILPFVIKSITEALRAVPQEYADGAMALGATKWRAVFRVCVPAARRGIVTGVVLGMGRIMGDTAIVWLTLGGTLRMTGPRPWYAPSNWLDTLKNTGSTLTSYIYYTSPAGEGDSPSAAFGASLVLIAVIILLNITASVLGGAGSERRRGR